LNEQVAMVVFAQVTAFGSFLTSRIGDNAQ
jgi:hypothetical protein